MAADSKFVYAISTANEEATRVNYSCTELTGIYATRGGKQN